jgi:hypothetical protein
VISQAHGHRSSRIGGARARRRFGRSKIVADSVNATRVSGGIARIGRELSTLPHHRDGGALRPGWAWEDTDHDFVSSSGPQVTFDDDEDLDRYGTGQRDRDGIAWCRADDPPSSGESAPVVAIGPAPGSGGRAVVRTAPMESNVWGTIEPDEGVALYREDQQIGIATVAWVHDTNRGLQPDELRMIIHWTQAGGPSPLR